MAGFSHAKCRKCSVMTRHDVLGSDQFVEYEDDDAERKRPPVSTHDFALAKCRACDIISFLFHDSDGLSDIVPDQVLVFPSWPVRTPKHFPSLPAVARSLYKESVVTLNSGTLVGCTILVRALVESVCKEKAAVGGDLKERINDLATKGVLAKAEAEFLHEARFAGNDAAHEADGLPADVLGQVLDIVESLLQNVYELPVMQAALKARRDAKRAAGAAVPVAPAPAPAAAPAPAPVAAPAPAPAKAKAPPRP